MDDTAARAGVFDGSGGATKVDVPHIVAIRVPVHREPTAVLTAGISGSLHTGIVGIGWVEVNVEEVRSIATGPV